jgi:hypothetical protein
MLETIIMSSIALLFSLLSLVFAGLKLRIQRIYHLKGPELNIRFEEDEDLLVLENIGSEALRMSVEMFVEPVKDDRYPKESTPVRKFNRILYPMRPKRFMNPSLAFLTEMGYRQDFPYWIRFRGSFWSVTAGKKYSRQYEKDYKVAIVKSSWLYFDESDNTWCYENHLGELTLERSDIPTGLQKKDQFRQSN